MATYYVAKTGVDGAGVDGSATTPWLTLTYAESRASNGDTVNVKAGTYAETDGGTYKNLVVAKSIAWVACNASWTPTVGAVTIQPSAGASYVMRITGPAANTLSFTGFIFDGAAIASGGINPISSMTGTLTFANCTFTTQATGGYLIYSLTCAGTINFNTCTATVGDGGAWKSLVLLTGNTNLPVLTIDGGTWTGSSTTASLFTIGHANTAAGSITIKNATLSLGIPSGNYHAINITGGSEYAVPVTIQDCTINTSAITYAAIVLGTGQHTFDLLRNTFTASGVTGSQYIKCDAAGADTIRIIGNTFNLLATQAEKCVYILNQSGAQIIGNTIRAVGDAGATGFTDIEVACNEAVDHFNTMVCGNTIYHSGLGAYSILVGQEAAGDGDNRLDGAIIQGNIIFGPLYYNPAAVATHHAIIAGHTRNVRVYNNTVIGGGYGVIVKHSGGDWNWQGGIEGNLIVDPYVNGILVKGVVKAHVAHNTVYTTLSVSTGMIRLNEMDTGEDSTNCRLQFNVVQCPAAIPAVYLSADQTFAVCDYNLYYSPDGTLGAPSFNIATVAKTWTEWKAAGYDTKSPTPANPEFVDAPNNLHLLPSSPAINPLSGTSANSDAVFLWKSQWAYGSAAGYTSYKPGAPFYRTRRGSR